MMNPTNLHNDMSIDRVDVQSFRFRLQEFFQLLHQHTLLPINLLHRRLFQIPTPLRYLINRQIARGCPSHKVRLCRGDLLLYR